MRAKKSLGQHFLMHPQTARRIADAAKLTAKDTVLEIGPGTGMLTTALLERAGNVIAVETDEELIPQLKTVFAPALASGQLTLIEQDIRLFNPSTIAVPYALVANIPYYLTGEIIRMFLSAAHKPSSMTVLVQKEVAERIARSKKESLLSLSVKVYGTPQYCFTVPRGAFVPAPSVDSAVLRIGNIRNPFATKKEEERFFEVLRTGFAHKRKRLGKNLEAVAPAHLVTNALQEAGVRPDIRPEDVSLAAWKHIAQKLP